MINARPSLSIGDVVTDAIVNLRSRLGRSIGVGIAAALGVSTLVGAIQIAASADAQVRDRILRERPEVVIGRPIEQSNGLSADVSDALLVQLADLPAVQATSVVQRLALPATVRVGPRAGSPVAVATSAGDLVRAAKVRLRGRSFHRSELNASAHVVMVGRRVATSLDLALVDLGPTIWIDGSAYLVIGIVEDSDLAPDLIDQIVIPRSTALDELGPEPVGGFDTALYLRAAKSEVSRIARDLDLRISPERPENWRIEVPRVSVDLASAISSDVRELTLASGALVLFIGAVGIGNAMLRSVYTRVHEIGLRRALGARTSHIVSLLMVEAAVIGLIAGVLGTVVGISVAGAAAARNGWPLAIGPLLPTAGVLLSVGAALAGAAWPTRVATKISAAEALRRD